jgi:ArsR family transcriptional regulator, arsenate/arsenite/antimonite-responsive transcriptional repressor
MPKPLPIIHDSSPICCAPLGSPLGRLTLDDAIALAIRLKALAEPARLQLVDYLSAQPNQEACTCDMAPVVGLAESTTSHHLKQLLTAGLVTKRRQGMNVHYRIRPDALTAIATVLNSDRGDRANLR